MKNKDIVIDFTSLLDVTLIIIFFFIMFSTFDTDNEKKKAVGEDLNGDGTVDANDTAYGVKEANGRSRF